jgi:hypothetical protein
MSKYLILLIALFVWGAAGSVIIQKHGNYIIADFVPLIMALLLTWIVKEVFKK